MKVLVYKSIVISVAYLLLPALAGADDTATLFGAPNARGGGEFTSPARKVPVAVTVTAQNKAPQQHVVTPPQRIVGGQGVEDMFADLQPIFPSGSADTTFKPPVSLNKGPQFGSFSDDGKKQVEALPGVPGQHQNAGGVDDKAPPPQNADEILSRFGDPETETPVQAQENAPVPFKGMMAALQVGDKDLAYRYARQYMRYVNRVQDRATTALNLQRLAKEREGYVAPGSNLDNPEHLLLEKDFAGSEEQEAERARIASLDPATQQLLQDASRAEGTNLGLNGFAQPITQSEQHAELANIQKAHGSEMPVDPKGEVDVLFFFNPIDRESKEMAREFERAYQNLKGSSKIRFVGLFTNGALADGGQNFRSTTKVTFPMRSGIDLAERLKLKSSPTVVIMARNSGDAVYEQGFRGAAYLKQVISMVGGEK